MYPQTFEHAPGLLDPRRHSGALHFVSWTRPLPMLPWFRLIRLSACPVAPGMSFFWASFANRLARLLVPSSVLYGRKPQRCWPLFRGGTRERHSGTLAPHRATGILHTRLEAPASAALRELGEESLVEHGSEAFCADYHPVPATLSEGILYDCLEICRGAGPGSWSRAHSAVGLVVHDGVDVTGPRFRYLD